jgi:Protein-tyrosine phosphatase
MPSNLALAPTRQSGTIGDLRIPEDFYWVLQEGWALAGMPIPRSDFPWHLLPHVGISKVVCLTGAACTDPSPLEVLHVAPLTDLFGGGHPHDPEAEELLIHAAADAVVAQHPHTGVAVHCVGGRGRTGTVIGVALARLGFDPEEVIDFLDAVHKRRGKPGWPESEWQAGVVRRAATGKRENHGDVN